MLIPEIAPVATVAQSRTKSREEARSERKRTSFSPRHVILDFSREALQRIGRDPLASDRTPQPPLFIYNGSGDFAYDEAARRYADAQRHAATQIEFESQAGGSKDELTDPKDAVPAPALPSFVTFDGMLGNRPGS